VADGYVYTYSGTAGASDVAMRLGRAPRAEVDDRSGWEFRTAEGAWSPAIDDAATVPGLVEQPTTVAYNGYLDRFVAAVAPVEDDAVIVQTAPEPWGPWSEPVEVYDWSAVEGDRAESSGPMLVPWLDDAGGRIMRFAFTREGPDFGRDPACPGEVRLVTSSSSNALPTAEEPCYGRHMATRRGGRAKRIASASALSAGIVGLTSAPASASVSFDTIFKTSGTYCGFAAGFFEHFDWIAADDFLAYSETQSRQNAPACDTGSPAPANTFAAQAKLQVGVYGWNICRLAPHDFNQYGEYKGVVSATTTTVDGPLAPWEQCASNAPHRLLSTHRITYGGVNYYGNFPTSSYMTD